MAEPEERTNHWLGLELEKIWSTYFADVPQANHITIRFGPNARARLGSIKQRGQHTTITVSGYFRQKAVPETIIQETIAHELVHYTHGFESPLPKLYRYPHEGRVVQQELTRRGLGAHHRAARLWLKTHWLQIVGPPHRRRRRHRHRLIFFR